VAERVPVVASLYVQAMLAEPEMIAGVVAGTIEYVQPISYPVPESEQGL